MAITDIRGATVDATDAPSSSTPNAGLAIKTAVRVATTGANIALNGLQTIDGVALAEGDRVLVKDQTDQTTNGIYNVSTGNWALSSDFQNNTQLADGQQLYVNFGALNGNTAWVLQAADPITLGTTALTFVAYLSVSMFAASQVAPFYAVIHPSSGNFQGSGNPVSHQLVWSDANPQFNADVMQMFSTDPSAALNLTVGGTATAGDVITLTFSFQSSSYPVFYTVQAGDTLSSIAAGLAAAIKADRTLYVQPSASNTQGGGPPGAIYFAVANGAVVGMDHDARISKQIKYSVTGAATETITVPPGYYNSTLEPGGSTQNTNYQMPNALDNNPALVFGRFVSGMAPPPFSLIFALYATSNSSASLSARNINYGAITHIVVDSTANATASRWTLQTVASSGALGPFFAQQSGAFTTNGADMGVDTVDAHVGFYVAEKYAVWNNASNLQIDTFSTGNPILLNTSGGVGVNVIPTNATFTSALGLFISGTQVPSTGSGLSLTGGATPAINSENFGTSSQLTLAIKAQSVTISSTTGAAVLNVGVAGSVAGSLTVAGSSSGALTIKPAAAAGTNTITLPAGTTDFSATGGASQVVKQTGSGGAFTVAQLAFSDISGTAALNQGGTAASLTASNGGIVYSTATALAILAGTATANQLLLSGASAAPAWSTSTWPADVSGSGQILNSSGAHTWTATATPTIGTSLTCPLQIGGTAAGSALTLQSTSGVGSGDSIVLQGGNNGATSFGIFNATKLALPQTTASSSQGTGALTVAGGVGIAGALYCGAITSSGNLAISAASPFCSISDGGTSYAILQIIGNSHPLRIGNEGSSGGSIFSGSSANAGCVGTVGAFPMQFFTNGALVFSALSAGLLQFNNAANFTANGATAASLGSTSPGHGTVQKWLTIQDGSAGTFYLPCF